MGDMKWKRKIERDCIICKKGINIKICIYKVTFTFKFLAISFEFETSIKNRKL